MSAPDSGRRWRLLVGLIGLTLVGGSLAAPLDTAAAATRDRYLVQTTSTSATARPLAKAQQGGGTVLTRFSRVLSGFTAELTRAQAVRLADDPSVVGVVRDVAYSVENKRVESSASQTAPPWGLDRIDQRDAVLDGQYDYLGSGTGGTAFVLDTGIRMTHSQFGGRAVSGYDFYDGDTNASDCAGHGTHVAGTIGGSTYGVAKSVRLVAVRVLDCNGDGYVIDMINALEWVAAHKPSGPAVVNMSLGFEVDASSAQIAAVVDQAVNKVVRAGIPVVVAAGNDGDFDVSACDYSPARVPAAITVGASDVNDTKASFSNLGSCVDVYAPGVDVLSSWWTSNSDAGYLDGTSMAAPHVAGAVARFQQDDPLATPASLTSQLLGRATPGVISGAEDAGTPNLVLVATPPAQLAGAPVGVTASTSDSRKTVTVRWSPPASTGGSDVTGYRVIRTGSADTGAKRVAVANLPVTSSSYTFAGLLSGGSYAVRVLPITAEGPGAAGGVTARLLAVPGTPGIGKASSGTKSKGITITARWAKPTSGGAVATYQVRADRVGSSKDKTVTVSSASRSVVITGLAKKKKYVITVRASNVAGTGAWSKKSATVTAR